MSAVQSPGMVRRPTHSISFGYRQDIPELHVYKELGLCPHW